MVAVGLFLTSGNSPAGTPPWVLPAPPSRLGCSRAAVACVAFLAEIRDFDLLFGLVRFWFWNKITCGVILLRASLALQGRYRRG